MVQQETTKELGFGEVILPMGISLMGDKYNVLWCGG
jgi:hypothetical protein